MPEKSTEMEAYMVHYECEDCGRHMHPTGVMLPTLPAQYPHKCPGCGKEETFLRQYPHIEHRVKEG